MWHRLCCFICGKLCKKGVKLICCGVQGCLSCVTETVLTNKKCWGCSEEVTTEDIVGYLTLRMRIEKFHKGEYPDSNNNTDTETDSETEDETESEDETEVVTLRMMMNRNSDFDTNMNAEERSCEELRMAAQLELLFNFQEADATCGMTHAVCLLCGKITISEEIAQKHLQQRHNQQIENMKIAIGFRCDRMMHACLKSSLKAEFLFVKN